jgi:hypothetical protein
MEKQGPDAASFGLTLVDLPVSIDMNLLLKIVNGMEILLTIENSQFLIDHYNQPAVQNPMKGCRHYSVSDA